MLPGSGSKQLYVAAVRWFVAASKWLETAVFEVVPRSCVLLLRSGSMQLRVAASKWLAVAGCCLEVARSSFVLLLRSGLLLLGNGQRRCVRSGLKQLCVAAALAVAGRCFEVARNSCVCCFEVASCGSAFLRSGSSQLRGAASRLAEVCLWLLRIGSKQLHRAASKWLASSGLPLRQSGAKQLSGAAAKWLAVACRCFDVARSSGVALLRSSKHWFVAASKWLEAAVWCCCFEVSTGLLAAASNWLEAAVWCCFKVASSGLPLLRRGS